MSEPNREIIARYTDKEYAESHATAWNQFSDVHSIAEVIPTGDGDWFLVITKLG